MVLVWVIASDRFLNGVPKGVKVPPSMRPFSGTSWEVVRGTHLNHLNSQRF